MNKTWTIIVSAMGAVILLGIGRLLSDNGEVKSEIVQIRERMVRVETKLDMLTSNGAVGKSPELTNNVRIASSQPNP